MVTDQARLSNVISLWISCSNLPNVDYGSLTDGFIVIFENTSQGKKEIGRTEIVANSLNPEFIKEIQMRFYFEKTQNVRNTFTLDAINGLWCRSIYIRKDRSEESELYWRSMLYFAWFDQ